MTFCKHLPGTRLLICLLLFIASSALAWADTRYVSDQLIISMREGTGPDDPVVTYLMAGNPVEVLEETENHLLVQIADGKQGWVRSKYIETELPKWMVIKGLNSEIERLQARIDSLDAQTGEYTPADSHTIEVYETKIKNLETAVEKQRQVYEETRKELDEMNSRHTKLLDDFNNLSQQNAALSKRSDTSAALGQEIKQLKQTNQELGRELETLRQSGRPTLLTNGIRWFLTGGGVLLLGVILGKSVRRKKGYGY